MVVKNDSKHVDKEELDEELNEEMDKDENE
jgi:hypothetical protein